MCVPKGEVPADIAVRTIIPVPWKEVMNKTIPALMIAALAALTFAQSGKAKPAKTPKSINCPVMTKSKVDIATATKNKMFADYKGRRYFFCCAGCPEAFKANPAKFAKQPSIPTPKKKA